MTTGIVGDLDMADARLVRPIDVGQFAFHPLRVVDVVLQIRIRMGDFIQHAEHLGRRIERKTRNIA